VKELETAGKITYGSNVKEVTTQVSEGTVDCGIVYATDAASAGLESWTRATKTCAPKSYIPSPS
jgi:molybdate transport system substrate-binding protein